MKTLFIDLETTGLSGNKDTIIELAAILDQGGKEKAVFHKYCRPQERPGNFDKVTELTGITWEFLEKHGLPESVLFNSFLAFLDENVNKFDRADKMIFCAYNAKFDEWFIRQFFKRYDNKYFGAYFYTGVLDILGTVNFCIRRGLIGVPPSLKNADVAKFLKIKVDEKQLHSALYDMKLSKQIEETLENKIFERN